MAAPAPAPRLASAVVLDGPGRLVRRQLPVPEVGDDDAVVRVEACGLCGTDHEQYSGVLPVAYAFVPGHETVGVVEAVGPAAARRWGVAVGDRVAVEVFQSCRSCAACVAGDHRRCARHGLGDMYGFIPVDRPPGLWGGYATHQYLGPDSLVLKVPDGLDPVVATLFNPLGAGLRWASTLPGTGPGDVVAVLGCGIRGLAALVAAREAGADFVMVTGRGARDHLRLQTARRFGADLVVDIDDTDPVPALLGAVGPADVVIDVTAKAPGAAAQAVALARAGGTIVVAGTRGTADTRGFQPDHLVYKELRVLGALGVDTAAYASALALLGAGTYPWDEVPRRVVGLDDVEELLVAMAGTGDQEPPVHGVLVP